MTIFGLDYFSSFGNEQKEEIGIDRKEYVHLMLDPQDFLPISESNDKGRRDQSVLTPNEPLEEIEEL